MIDGKKCEHCVKGVFELTECPRSFVGEEMTQAINLTAMCGKGDWPIAGGLLDQSAWFISLKQAMQQERNNIQAEEEAERGD